MKYLTWTAYCTDCKKVLAACDNGDFAEAIARRHISDTEHQVYVGYRVNDRVEAEKVNQTF